MKKRKILLGLALAAAAVFSLSACGDDTTTPAQNTPAQDTGTGTGEGTGTGTGTGTPTTEKVKVQYYKVIEGESPVEITAAKQEINKGSTTTKPETALALDGYRIVECYTSAGCTDVFDFTKAINADAKVYVKYVELSKYDEIAGSTGKIAAFDFNTTTTVTKVSDLKFDSTTGTPAILTNVDTVKAQNDVLSFGTVNGNALVNLGQKCDASGIYSIYAEMTFRAVESSDGSIFQVNGTTGSSYTNVFEIRSNKGKLAYACAGDSVAKTDVSPEVALTQGKTIKIFIQLNTADGHLKVNVNGSDIYDANTIITGIDGLKFQQDTAKTQFDVDNIAVGFEAKTESALVSAKKTLKNTINTYLGGTEYEALDAAVKTLVTTKANAIKSAVDTATEVSVVTAKSTEWETFVAADKPVVTVKAYTAANTATTADDYKIALVAGDTFDTSKVSFTGYTIAGIYTNEALDAEYTAGAVSASVTLYAKVNVATKTLLKADDKTAGTEYAADSTLVSDSVITLKNKGIIMTIAADKSAATANDDSNVTFARAWLPSGDTKTTEKYYELTTTESVTVTIYFTCTNSGFTTTDQSKGGELQIDGTAVTSSGNKSNKTAYAYSFKTAANTAYKINSSSNRLAIFAISYEK